MFSRNLLAEELAPLDASAQSLYQQHSRFINNKIGDAFRDLI